MDPQIARKLLRDYRGDVKACHLRVSSAEDPKPGRIEASLIVGPKGRVSSARVLRNTVGSARFAACALKAMRTWNFPKPSGGPAAITARYTLP